eukprot:985249-Amphidinium_carterae.1
MWLRLDIQNLRHNSQLQIVNWFITIAILNPSPAFLLIVQLEVCLCGSCHKRVMCFCQEAGLSPRPFVLAPS